MDPINAGMGIRVCRNDGKGAPVWDFFCWVSSRRWHSGEVPYRNIIGRRSSMILFAGEIALSHPTPRVVG